MQRGQEARAEILERGGRSVEQLEHTGVASPPAVSAAAGKSKASAQIAAEFAGQRIAGEERSQQPRCDRGHRIVAGEIARAKTAAAIPARTGRHRRPVRRAGRCSGRRSAALSRVEWNFMRAPLRRRAVDRGEKGALAKPACSNAAHMAGAAASAAARSSNQANTLGPAPEIAGAHRVVVERGLLDRMEARDQRRAARLDSTSARPARTRSASPRWQPARTRARFPLCATNSSSV